MTLTGEERPRRASRADGPSAAGDRGDLPPDPRSAHAPVPEPGAPRPRWSSWARLASWGFGVLALSALVIVVLHLGELERFAAIARESRPIWLVAALVLQSFTYVAAAALWFEIFRRGPTRRRLRSFLPLGLVKLFADQALPSGGLSGTLVVVRAFTRRGIARPDAVAALLVGLVSYYAAYLTVVAASLVVLAIHHDVHRSVIVLAILFAAAVCGISVGVLLLRRHEPRHLAWLRRIRAADTLLDLLREAPGERLRDLPLLARVTALQGSVFLLDAATLWVALHAAGGAAGLDVALAAYVVGSMVATLGPIPLGLGTFEASCVAMLRGLGVDLEVAFTATLVFRALTFWLPMLPGLWLTRRELRRAAEPTA